MNSIVLHLASGHSLFSGTAVVLLGLVLACLATKRWVRFLRDVCLVLGVVLIRLSATPFPAAVYWLFLLLAIVTLVGENLTGLSGSRLRPGLRVALALAALGLVGWELPHRGVPEIPPHSHACLYVVRDSISAGIGGKAWPAMFAERHRITTVNVAEPGATTGDALKQTQGIPPGPALILVEIGGNDLLNLTPAEQFSSDLDMLLTRLQGPGRTIVMLELPLIPLYESYGRAQRQLAAKHHVTLLPKSILASTFTAADATSDGLHLSPQGAMYLGDRLAPILFPGRGSP